MCLLRRTYTQTECVHCRLERSRSKKILTRAQEIKNTATEIFGKACFQLHKWSSNARGLEASIEVDNEGGVTYAKEQLGVKPEECGLLGMKWNKDANNMAVSIP